MEPLIMVGATFAFGLRLSLADSRESKPVTVFMAFMYAIANWAGVGMLLGNEIQRRKF